MEAWSLRLGIGAVVGVNRLVSDLSGSLLTAFPPFTLNASLPRVFSLLSGVCAHCICCKVRMLRLVWECECVCLAWWDLSLSHRWVKGTRYYRGHSLSGTHSHNTHSTHHIYSLSGAVWCTRLPVPPFTVLNSAASNIQKEKKKQINQEQKLLFWE